ncbi:MAG: bifunctional oligoribonuclease/PAP phosphatase NrnA [Rhodothermales bacterium]|nr:bifunctional oligoribonuclease/PAP phosphatase NrnA [Rhodothermales bacterium]
MTFFDRLRDHERYVLTTHVRPDGDAIGSTLALARVLERLGKTVTVALADAPPDTLATLPGADAIQPFDGSVAQREAIARADAVVVLDANQRSRLGDVGPALATATNAESFLIDHHTMPEDWFDQRFVRESASSAGELVYDIVEAWEADTGEALIDRDVATLLYAAIMTDTGSFRYPATTPRVHRIVADLMERTGFTPTPVHEAIFDGKRLGALRLLADALRTITLHAAGRVATMTLSRRMLQASDAHTDEAEGFVNYALSLRGVDVAILFTETAGGVKISFRSKGDHPVHEWARAFGGGGHRNASGAFVKRPLDALVADVVAAAPRFLPGYVSDAVPDVAAVGDDDLLALLRQKYTG